MVPGGRGRGPSIREPRSRLNVRAESLGPKVILLYNNLTADLKERELYKTKKPLQEYVRDNVPIKPEQG